MNWNNHSIGENAGIVWRVLNHNEMSWDELQIRTGLNPLELASAIGWLAREGKIYIQFHENIIYFSVFHENYY